MATDVVMPKWGLTMKAGKVSRWFKSEGETIQKGEPLFEVETDKITNAVEAPVSGVLFQIVVPAGETVPVQTVVAVLAEAGEVPERRTAPELASAPQQTATDVTPAADKAGGAAFIRATPLARRLARERGIDLSRVTGTGPNGRVTEKDILDFKEMPPAPSVNASPQTIELAAKAGIDLAQITGSGEGGRILKVDILRAMNPVAQKTPAPTTVGGMPLPGILPLTGIRKIIADNMMASLHNSAQLTVFVDCDATAMTVFRDRVRNKYAGREDGLRISYNDIIALAVCRTLMDFSIINSWLTDDGIVVHDQVNLGIAVALDNGLVVPNVKAADRKTLPELAKEIRVLADKAKTGGLTMDEIQGGTFTITNVSMLGVDGFTPILNPPETAILGVGRAVDRPAVVDGQIVVRKMMTLSLTFDHRVTDGVPAMRFLRALADCVEEPAMILA
ncbi:MAG: 2-oxo acid dehydrogenase subunit E2 [Deltaproteobacteria bacterium]|nr:2-oxo acid dehydrogenase subunit E2 [Deltaproteobacteria bacterium]